MTLRYWSSPQPTELTRKLGAGICNTSALHWYRRGHRFKSFLWASIFFRPYFHYYFSSDHNYEDCFYIHDKSNLTTVNYIILTEPSRKLGS